MIEKTYKITNQTGLDAKNSSVLVSKCGKYNRPIFIKDCGGKG